MDDGVGRPGATLPRPRLQQVSFDNPQPAPIGHAQQRVFAHEHFDIVPVTEQKRNNRPPDETCSTSDENPHGFKDEVGPACRAAPGRRAFAVRVLAAVPFRKLGECGSLAHHRPEWYDTCQPDASS